MKKQETDIRDCYSCEKEFDALKGNDRYGNFCNPCHKHLCEHCGRPDTEAGHKYYTVKKCQKCGDPINEETCTGEEGVMTFTCTPCHDKL